ncbi:hypothetical protein AbraIFM66950_012149 [Aspergillus brasiliensis]|nr:hypothetical protein AbraIFM66950_012149 [Aspergillus brasiliensis]
MKGTIAIEEAVLNPKYAAQHAVLKDVLSVYSCYDHTFPSKLVDIHGERLQKMDEHGVEYMVLSMTSAGPQSVVDADLAAKMASDNNDYLAAEVAKNPKRFGAFAQLSMHDPVQAAAELRRAVTELGMLGALVNDWQSTLTADGQERKLYYDTEEFDPFWSEVQALDVPVYFHPRYALPQFPQEPWGSRIQLQGAGVGFSLDLSWHLYALCSGGEHFVMLFPGAERKLTQACAGLFDRFPRLKIIVGHFGENIPLNLWRASYQYNRMMGTHGRKSKEDYSYYWRRNFFITTSGDFHTEGLKFVIKELGLDRCLYSIDHPYSDISEGQDWWKTVDLPEKEKEAVARGNAIRLLKLPLEI